MGVYRPPRMAVVVPTVRATRSDEIQPLPTLAVAPSPRAGNQGGLRKAGHRAANLGKRPCRGIFESRPARAVLPELAGCEQGFIPGEPIPVEQSRPGGHGIAYRRFSEELHLKILSDRYPPETRPKRSLSALANQRKNAGR